MNELYNWRTLAAQTFPGAQTVGRGQFAVVACDGKAVWLAPTEDNAHAAALGSCHLGSFCKSNHSIKNLKPCPVPDIRDDYEDRQWKKRQSTR
jgi:hypothetical protein